MNYKRIVLSVFLLLFAACGAFAQNYDEPSSMRWLQLKSPHFKVVYPRGGDSVAQRYANVLERSYMPVSRSLNNYNKRPISLVLHINDLNSNAQVSYAPFQMDFMTAPYTNLHLTPWDKGLALHEYRHCVQVGKYKTRGALRVAHWLLGDYASTIWGIMIPNWFFEGDATYSETAMSLSGRGRMPHFFAEYRAYLLSGVNFSHDKWLQGSYKHYIPSVYHYGYIQTAYARMKFGNNVWQQTLERAQTKNFLAFGRAFKNITGTSVPQLRKESFEYLKNEWQKENRQPEQNVEYLTDSTKNYTRFYYPAVAEDGDIIAVRSDFKHIPSIVKIGKSKIEHLADIGYYTDRVQTNGSRVYWLEDIRSARWTAKSLNTIKFYDLQTGKMQTAVAGSRYRALGFSNNNNINEFVAAEYSADGKTFVCSINKIDFTETRRVPTPQNAVVTSLAMCNNVIIASLISDKGISLQMYNDTENRWIPIINWWRQSIENITASDNEIIFQSNFDGLDNLYVVDMEENAKIRRITNSQFGAKMPSVNNNNILYAEFYANGLKIAQKHIDNLNKTFADKSNLNTTNAFIDTSKPYKYKLAEIAAAQEKFIIDTINTDNFTTYSSSKYSKAANLFRVHSWMPLYAGLNSDYVQIQLADNNDNDDEDYDNTSLGATLISQNVLGSAQTQLAYSYRNGYSAVHAGFTYSGWFPIIDVKAHYGGGKNSIINEGVFSRGNDNRFLVEARAYAPLNFSNARYARGVTPSVKFSINNTKYYAPSADKLKRSTTAEASIYAYAYKQMSTSDIFPQWGFVGGLYYKNSPFDTENFGDFYGAKAIIYTPGLFVNHGIKLSASYQRQKGGRYYMKTLFDFPREYGNGASQKMTMFTVDYSLPIAYPEFNIGSLLYVNRIRANLFYDYARNTNTFYGTRDIYSRGVDVILDSYFFRIQYPIAFGLRFYKAKNDDNIGVKFLINLSL